MTAVTSLSGPQSLRLRLLELYVPVAAGEALAAAAAAEAWVMDGTTPEEATQHAMEVVLQVPLAQEVPDAPAGPLDLAESHVPVESAPGDAAACDPRRPADADLGEVSGDRGSEPASPARRLTWTPERCAELERRYVANESFEDIAKVMHLSSAAAAQQQASKLELPKKHPGCRRRTKGVVAPAAAPEPAPVAEVSIKDEALLPEAGTPAAPRRWTSEREDELASRFWDGEDEGDIAVAMGVSSADAISAQLTRMGLYQARKDRLVDLLQAATRLPEIAAALRLTEDKVKALIRQYGLGAVLAAPSDRTPTAAPAAEPRLAVAREPLPEDRLRTREEPADDTVAVSIPELVEWLGRDGCKVAEVGLNQWRLGRADAVIDAAGLLAAANVRRRHYQLPPFRLEG